jgi:hypothetical protein
VPAPESLDLTTAQGQARAVALGLLSAPQASPAAGKGQSPPGPKRARQRKPRGRESAVVKGCLDYLALRGIPAWRVNCGAMRGEHKGKRWFVRFNGAQGCADILAVLPGSGRLLACECKRPGGRLRPAQAAFLDRVRAAGGVALCVDSVAALAKALDAEGV